MRFFLRGVWILALGASILFIILLIAEYTVNDAANVVVYWILTGISVATCAIIYFIIDRFLD